MKSESIVKRILWNLDYDARLPLNKLAKKVGISKQNLNYHLNKLVRDKVIRKFTTVIDLHKLGYLTYRLYIRYKDVDGKREKEIIDYFREHGNVIWFVSLVGSWDLEVVFGARNFIHFNNIFKKVREEIGDYFSKYDVSMSVVNYHFKRDYLLDKRRRDFSPSYYGFEPDKVSIDDLDYKILGELSKDCSNNNVSIGEKIGVTYQTIKQRIKKLEEGGVIQNHRILFDIGAAGREYHKILLKLNSPSKGEEKDLYEFCSRRNFVVYIVEVLGDIQMEIETEVENQGEVNKLLRDLKNEFPSLITDYDILQVTKEHKLDYLPAGLRILNDKI